VNELEIQVTEQIVSNKIERIAASSAYSGTTCGPAGTLCT